DGDSLRRLRHRDGVHLPVGRSVSVARVARTRRDVRVSCGRHRRARLRLEKRRPRVGELAMPADRSTVTLEGSEQGFATTRLDALLGWARKYSLFQYPFVTACCGMEFMAVASPRFDLARFGAEAPRFSPRQADLLWVVGTISQRQAPALRRIYEQMMEPK